MPTTDFGIVRNAPAALTLGAASPATLDASGALVTIDFYAKAILDGRGFQVRAGTITTPLTGDILITDTFAEMCADATAGLVMIPIFMQVDIEALGGTLPQVAAKSVATVSSAGTAFVPLLLKSDGSAASSTARVQAAGAVTVTGELATTTPRHFSWSQPIAAGAWPTWYDWQPLYAPTLVGPRCFYVQVAADTTGPSYFANIDYLELPTLLVTPS